MARYEPQLIQSSNFGFRMRRTKINSLEASLMRKSTSVRMMTLTRTKKTMMTRTPITQKAAATSTNWMERTPCQ